MLTPRVKKLKEQLRSTKPNICVERAKLTTEAYKKFFNEPPVLLRAKLLDYLLENKSIVINEGELIVGNLGSKYRSAPVFPEYGARWIINEIDEFPTRGTDPLYISEEEKSELLDILGEWDGKGFAEVAESYLSEEVLEAERAGVLSVGSRITSTGHVVPNYPKLLNLGLVGIMEQAEEEMAKIGPRTHDNQRKHDFLNAAIITCKAAIKFAERFSAKAKELSENTEDPVRKKELLEIAEICKHVPKNPPRSFHEALQFQWFIHLIMQIETNGHSIGLGRFDQHMYKYYKEDIESGKITRDEAIELIQCMWIKMTELLKIRDRFEAEAFAGYPLWQNMAIGGQTPEGLDATNELSFAILDAYRGVQTVQPSCSFRHHDNINREFFRKALKMSQDGLAMPAFYNDKLVIPLVLAKGATIEEARDWSIEGCVEPFVTGKSDGRPVVGYINGLKIIELILNNGVDPLTGKQIGLKTGELDTFKSLDDIMVAFEKNLKHFIKLMLDSYNIVGSLHATRLPAVFASITVDDCIAKGKSLQEGGAKYNFSAAFITALANTVDSLAAIEEVVFKDKTLTLKELNEILKTNFEGNERIRQLLINKPPKYGNDNDFVDGLARKILAMYNHELENYRDSRGGKYILTVLSTSFNVLQGKCTGASPDGRKAFEPNSDNASPYVGRDVKGPTAVLKSVAKIDQMNSLAGALLNLKFDSNIVKGEKGLDILENVVETYFDLMGEHIQFNVASAETLKAAQKNPEEYANLMVRVAGYSAYFIELDKAVQDNIIARTAHNEAS
ncbi:MAG: glycyl radical protein [Tepidanaerobacteraceae bacterium]